MTRQNRPPVLGHMRASVDTGRRDARCARQKRIFFGNGHALGKVRAKGGKNMPFL